MTLQNVIENMKMMFPRATESMIIKELDVAQRRFAAKTRILEAVGELSDIDTYISFSLPSDFLSLKGVYFYDSDDDPIYIQDLTIAAEVHDVNDTKKLTFRSIDLTPITEIPTSVGSIQIEYYRYPTAITARSSTLEIGEEYWEVLEMMAMVKFYKMFPTKVQVGNQIYDRVDWRAIGTLQKEIRQYELDAVVERNVGRDDRKYDVSIYTHAGEQYEALRSKVSGGTIQVEGGDVSYTKYYRITVDSSDESVTVESKSGFGTINVAVTKATPVITVTSPSNEFTSDPATWVWSNQGIRYTWDNAGQITFTPHSTSWGVVEIEIYIY